MDSKESFNEFIGFAVVALLVAAMLVGVGMLGQDPRIVTEIGSFSPWMGANVRILTGIAAVVIVTAGAEISFVSMTKNDGRLVVIGFVTCRLLMVASVVAIIPSVSFLLGVGWLGAKNFFGQ